MKNIVYTILFITVFHPLNIFSCNVEESKKANIELRLEDAINGFKDCFKQGDPYSTTMIGMIFLTDYYGVKDYEMAHLVLAGNTNEDPKSNFGLGYYYQYHPTRNDEGLANFYFENSFDAVQESANNGDVYWTTRLAWMYSHGLGVDQDKEKSFNLLCGVISSGYSIAMHNIGYAYYNGSGVTQNFDSAYFYYNMAADNGFTRSINGMYDVAKAYFYGNGVEVNLDKAEKLLEDVVNKGNFASIGVLGMTYFYQGDESKAKKLFELNLEMYPEMGFFLTFYYLKSTEKDHKKAQELLSSMSDYIDSNNTYGVAEYLKSQFYNDPDFEDQYDKQEYWYWLSQSKDKGYSFLFEPGTRVKIGNKAPLIVMKDTSENWIYSDKIKGKLILIDFWASWCTPCRLENPNLVKAYKKYHDKGFEIISVSFDKDMERWKKAIVKDEMDWTHMSDLKGWESMGSWLFGIVSIPSSVLIDSSGFVLAMNLRGIELQEILKNQLNQ